jgi:hypothetical protein
MHRSHRRVGITALVAAVWLVVGNLTHPIGSLEIYTDGALFVEHTVGTYWVVNHLLLAVAIMVAPWLVWAWRDTLAVEAAESWGTFALILISLGTLVSVLHLGGVDGVALPAYAPVLEAGGEAAVAGAEVMRMLHLATATTWGLILWGAAQTVLGVAEWLERRRPLLGGLLVLCGIFGFAFAGTIGVEGHLSGLSEGVFLRVSSVGLTVWLIWTAWEFARRDETTPADSVRS